MIKIILKFNQSYQFLVIIQILYYKFLKLEIKKSSQKKELYQIVNLKS